MNDLTFDADFRFVLFRVLSCRCLTCRVGRKWGKFSALQGDLDLSSLFCVGLIGLVSNYAKLNNNPQSIDFFQKNLSCTVYLCKIAYSDFEVFLQEKRS